MGSDCNRVVAVGFHRLGRVGPNRVGLNRAGLGLIGSVGIELNRIRLVRFQSE